MEHMYGGGLILMEMLLLLPIAKNGLKIITLTVKHRLRLWLLFILNLCQKRCMRILFIIRCNTFCGIMMKNTYYLENMQEETTEEMTLSIQSPTACMQLDYSAWENGYEELPCDVVETPESIVYPAVKNYVEDSLDYLIKRQSDDGAWHLTWSFSADERFRKMEALYEANYTMLILARLGRFNRTDI